MEAGFYMFAEHLIDYAGLFPPARLPMKEAVKEYFTYRNHPDSWMLGRFICPASRMEEFARSAEPQMQESNPFPLSVLGSGGKNETEFLLNFEKDLQAVTKFHRHYSRQAKLDLLELRLPGDLLQTPQYAMIAKFLDSIADVVEHRSPVSVKIFWEAGFSGDWKSTLAHVVRGIADHNQLATHRTAFLKYQLAGFKLRCGGETPEAYPTPEQVAAAIKLCAERQIPFKATAGLHHPIRNFHHGAGVKMHGFINLFAAGILALHHALDESVIRQIIEEEDSSHFVFDGKGLKWKDWQVNPEQIKMLRETQFLSFGSCSFDEPREDLRALGLLTRE